MAHIDDTPRTMVLGVGNLLAKDDGIGVQVIHDLEKYEFEPAVTVLEVGTAGHQLLNWFTRLDNLIIVDCMDAGEEPGSIFRFTAEDVRSGRTTDTSLHQMSLLEVLEMARAIGNLPATTIVAVQGEDMTPYGLELTEKVEAARPKVVSLVLDELSALGVSAMSRKA